MTFEQWWANEKWEGLNIATPAEAMAARRIASACWNAAIDATAERIVRCCCTHKMVEEHDDFGKCKVPGCDCMNTCSCWTVVFDSEEYLIPRRIRSYFDEVKAS
jgi:hypothetical protein